MTTHIDLARPAASSALSHILSVEDGRAAIIAAQLAAASRSADRLTRARTYANRLWAHAAEIRARLERAAGDDTAGPLRGELVEVERQRGQAAAVLAEVEAEHARHGADLASFIGPEGEARDRLVEVQVRRDAARTAADAAKVILDRATTHAGTVERRLTAARADEARHDSDAADRLHTALRGGSEVPATAEPFTRISGALEDDLRAARAAEVRLASDHRMSLSALAVVERQVRAATDAVLMSDADAMAREVQHLDARSKLLRDRIAAYAGRTAGDYVPEPWTPPKNIQHPGGWFYPEPGKLTVPPQPRTVARTSAILAVLPSRNDDASVPAEVAAWNVYASALARDPKAEPDFPVLSALDRTPALPDPSVTPASLSLLSSRTAA